MRSGKSDRLRIAQIAPVAVPVTPRSITSIEHLVWLLTEELVLRGHHVTLFATGNSETSAELYAVYARGYEQDDDLWNWHFHEMMHTAAAFEHAYLNALHRLLRMGADRGCNQCDGGNASGHRRTMHE